MPTGTCRLCGTVGPLSFEHVPPRAAFNDRPVFAFGGGVDVYAIGPDDEPRGRIQQRGMGAYTLCGRCNNKIGRWYAKPFVNWCVQGMEILSRSRWRPTLIHLNYLLPLSIIKQIAAMFFSVNQLGFADKNPELVKFVLDQKAKYLSPKYRFFVYFNHEGRFRTSPIVGMGNFFKRELSVMSEITYPPYGYVLTLGTPPPDPRLVEITHFARFDYNEFAVLEMRLPVLPTHTFVPGDYRTKEEIYKEAAADPLPA